MNVPNSRTPGGTRLLVHDCRSSRRGLPRLLSASAPTEEDVSRLYRPARSRAPLRFAPPVTRRCARVGFPEVDLPGQDLLAVLLMLHRQAHLLPHAGFTGAPASGPTLETRRIASVASVTSQPSPKFRLSISLPLSPSPQVPWRLPSERAYRHPSARRAAAVRAIGPPDP